MSYNYRGHYIVIGLIAISTAFWVLFFMINNDKVSHDISRIFVIISASALCFLLVSLVLFKKWDKEMKIKNNNQ